MMRYFDSPDRSPNDSLQEPLKELDFNESTGSYYGPLSSSKRSFKIESGPLTTKVDQRIKNRGSDNKENRNYATDKLPVYHRGPHGEQLGTLIVRHHEQKDSKCIQCRNCGIFFTVASFLKHNHDQYGKRAECNGVHLLLGLDSPTSQQREAWNTFQKKLLSDRTDPFSANSDFRHTKSSHSSDQNLSRLHQNSVPTEKKSHQRIRRSSVDLSFRRPTNSTQVAPSVKINSSLPRSREFLSSSALRGSQPNLLSLSQLSNAGMRSSHTDREINEKKINAVNRVSSGETPINRFESSWRTDMCDPLQGLLKSSIRGEAPAFEQEVNRDASAWLRDAPKASRPMLPTALIHRENTDATYDFGRNASTRPWDVPDMTSDDSFPQTKVRKPSNEDLLDQQLRPSSCIITSSDLTKHESGNTEASSDDKSTEYFITSAISLLQKASHKIKRDSGNTSNAWRKMYEEERDHRMKLEAKVRDLERELRSKS